MEVKVQGQGEASSPVLSDILGQLRRKRNHDSIKSQVNTHPYALPGMNGDAPFILGRGGPIGR